MADPKKMPDRFTDDIFKYATLEPAAESTPEDFEMRWFYLKVGKGNKLAKEWLTGGNPLKCPAVPIFFGRCSIADIQAGKCGRQEKDFYESSLPENHAARVIVVVSDGFVWFLKPAGNLKEHDPGADPDTKSQYTWKMMPVVVHTKLKMADVPPVLAGINANAFLSRGTFREISNWGNIKAVECALGRPLPHEHLAPENCTALRLLECLSSVELETLVAKLFEAAGCFVPAYRGGCVKDVDLFAHNESDRAIELGELVLTPKKRMAIQVKGGHRLNKCPSEVDCLIGFEISSLPKSFKHPNCYDGDWLLNQVKRFPEVIGWLKKSLSWLPSEFLAKYEI
jgi:hypothetical protein